MRISATLVTLNEARNLPRALASASFCDEILVVDSGSRDSTVEIARAHGARVVQNDWPGYAKQKNFAAEAASHDWILSLDADEEVSSALRDEIQGLRAGGPAHDAYLFPRLARYLGRWIRHGGWYPDAKVRLYDRRKGRWTGEYVHESVNVQGSVGRLRGDLLHYTCDDFAEHVRTVDRYTTLAADEILDSGRKVGWRHVTLSPAWAFWRGYVLQAGFLDGFEGYLIAKMAAFYVFSKYAKARARGAA